MTRPTPPSATLEPKHTREYHQALLEVWHTGDVGFLPHKYRRCGFSGAGNCCCGRDDRSRLHTATNAPPAQVEHLLTTAANAPEGFS